MPRHTYDPHCFCMDCCDSEERTDAMIRNEELKRKARLERETRFNPANDSPYTYELALQLVPAFVKGR